MSKLSKKSRQKLKQKQLKLILILSTLIIFILASIYEVKKRNSFEESFKYIVKGIDLSHHNPILKWEEVAKQGVAFAYIKASEGISHSDRNYIYNYELAKKNNVRIGAYHFFSFNSLGEEQAKHFIKTASLSSGDLYPAIDVEHSPSNVYSKDSSFRKNIIDELIKLENKLFNYYGIHPIIYTNTDCYNLYIKDNFPFNFIWISSINKEPSDKISNWIIWQFTHKGELNGLSENVDLNYFRYSLDQLKDITLP